MGTSRAAVATGMNGSKLKRRNASTMKGWLTLCIEELFSKLMSVLAFRAIRTKWTSFLLVRERCSYLAMDKTASDSK